MARMPFADCSWARSRELVRRTCVGRRRATVPAGRYLDNWLCRGVSAGWLLGMTMRPPSDSSNAETPPPLSSELLGFPPDARVLIINADDLGMYPEITLPIIESVERGVASSCSVMPPCPGADDALRLLADRRHIPFGIHLTMVSESPALRFAPVADRDRVTSLLDRSGHFRLAADRDSLLQDARIEEIDIELRAQVDSVIRAGLSPTHLDWHTLADGGRADIFELGLALAAEYGLAARVWLQPGRRTAREHGLPVVDHQFVDSFSLDVTTKVEQYATLMRGLQPGLNEWAVHPGAGPDTAASIDSGWPVRDSDLAYLTSPAARDQLKAEGIKVIDYRRLQDAWRAAFAGHVGTS